MTNNSKLPKRIQNYYGRLLKRFLGGSSINVLRGMAILVTGSGIARMIGIAAIPFLTRLYSPEDFGVLAIFTALVAILAPLVALRYSLALPLPRHDGAAFNLLVLSAALMFGVTAVVTFLLAIFGDKVLARLSMQVLAPWWWLIGLGILATAWYEILSDWATRKRAYKAIAITNVWQSALGALVQLAMGLATFTPVGLLLGQVVANGGGIGRLILDFVGDFRENWRYLSINRIKVVGGHYRGFPIYRVPSQFLIAFAQQSPLLFTAAIYGVSESGQLGLALMTIAMPVGILSTTLSRSFFAEAAEIADDPVRLRELSIAIAKRTAVVSLFPTLAIIFLSPILFKTIFGEKWVMAGWLAAILAIYIVPQFISQVLVQVLAVTNRNKIFLMFNVSRSILVVAALVIPPSMGASIYLTVGCYSFALSIQRFGQSLTILRLLKYDSNRIVKMQ